MSTVTGQPIGLRPGRASASATMSDSDHQSSLIALVASVAVLIGVYWNTLSLTKDFWSDPTYSHGWIIPFLALFLMWTRRNPRGEVSRDQENQNMLQVGIPLAVAVGCYFLGFYPIGWLAYAVAVVVGLAIVFRFHEFEPIAMSERWIGAGVIAASLLFRAFVTLRDIMPLDRYSFITSLFGVFLLAGGFSLVKRMWPAIAFFFFMFPLPSMIERSALFNLTRGAAVVSTVVLQSLGVVAHRQGAQIHIDGLVENLEVAYACSGLRMLTIFCAMVIALVLIIERPWWDKLILLLSAIPIALATNVIRITLTALLFMAVEGTSLQEPLHKYIHDVAGYAMIFIAAGIMWLEYKVLTWLFVEEGDERMQAVGIMGRVPPAVR